VVPTVQVALHASHADLPKISFKFFAKTQLSRGMKIQPECSVFPLLHFPSSPFPTLFYLAAGQCQGTFRAADFPVPCQLRRDTKLVPRTVPHPHCSDSYSPASHRGGPGSIPGESMSDVWWTKWHCDRGFSEYLCLTLPLSFRYAPHSYSCRAKPGKFPESNALSEIGQHGTEKYFQFLGV